MNELGDIENDVVIEFIKAVNVFCNLAESKTVPSKTEYVKKMLLACSGVYNLALVIPSIESINEQNNEKFVDENDWQKVKDNIQTIFGQYDAFLEVFDPRMQESEIPIISSISENIADIYQDLKDFILLFQIGTHEVMNDALWECKQNFEEFWGQKLTNIMRALHNLVYGNALLEEDDLYDDDNLNDIDTSNWIISKRIEQLGDEEDI
ncbi:MAG: DUF5063 domain-containing protein [Bacteroidales bacterium]|nr:DUF5063 domain-containing protein [Bacteroidales bacterium]